MSNSLHPVPDARRTLGGISHETFYKLVRSGELHVVKVGRRTFVATDELDRFIASRSSAA